MGVIGNILNRSTQTNSIQSNSSRSTPLGNTNNQQLTDKNNVAIPIASEDNNNRRLYSNCSTNNSRLGLRINSNDNNRMINQNQPQSSALSAETAAGAVTPLGLSGPNSFTFSPHVTSDSIKKRSRYLSFVSSSINQTSRFQKSNGSNKNERRLCVLDLEPFWEALSEKDARSKKNSDSNGSNSYLSDYRNDLSMDTNTALINQEKQRKLNTDEYGNNTATGSYKPMNNPLDQANDHLSTLSTQSKLQIPILNSNTVIKNHVDILLNSNSRHQLDQGILQSPPHPTRLNKQSNKYESNNHRIESESESSLSLEERLRRERQRLHTSGVTQFTWGKYYSDQSHEKQHQSKRTLTPPNPENINSQHRAASEKVSFLRLLVPLRGNIYVQDGIDEPLRLVYDKSMLQQDIQLIDVDGNSDRHRRRRRRNRETTGSVVGRDASAIDPQLSPDGSMVAFVVAGEIYVMSCNDDSNDDSISSPQKGFDKSFNNNSSSHSCKNKPVRVTYGAINNNNFDYYSSDSDCDDENVGEFDCELEKNRRSNEKECAYGYDKKHNKKSTKKRYGRCITHGLADFVAQEEMDRYRGFWWDNSSSGVLFTRVDESYVAPYRITHQGKDGFTGDESSYEDHRYPFAGEANPDVVLGFVKIDRSLFAEETIEQKNTFFSKISCTKLLDDHHKDMSNNNSAQSNWSKVRWFPPPADASEYLARVNWLPDGTVCAQWQDRSQSHLVLTRINVNTGETMNLHTEHSELWINLHHMFHILPRAVHPNECVSDSKLSPDSKLNSIPNQDERDLMDEDELCNQNEQLPTILPAGSFSFLFASERTGYCHLYLYTYVPGHSKATLIRAVSEGDWMVESIVGLDVENDVVYITGTFTSPLEQHLYALPLINKNGRFEKDIDARLDSSLSVVENIEEGVVSRGLKQVMNTISGASNKSPKTFRRRSRNIIESFRHEPLVKSHPIDPICLTMEPGVHNVQMDESCRIVVDTSSDLSRPPSTKVFSLPLNGPFAKNTDEMKIKNNIEGMNISKIHSRSQMELLFVLFDSALDELSPKKYANGSPSSRVNDSKHLNDTFGYHVPELLSFPTSDGTETLHAALFLPDKKIYGSGPYPLICSVYGGPHVQRVNRSWSQCVDMRVQRLRSLGLAVVKCDNRGSSRRGLAFESAIRRRLGRLEVLDQVTAVRHLVKRGVADPTRVGIYGWSYGGYLAAMCLCRAPDIFHVAIAGAPVTSWDGYDTHYTERYMGLPHENSKGYNEAAVFDHIPNMRGKLMIVHGLIDENVHFRHTARLINRLVTAGKDYDLLIFPDERHSPRRLRDRIYMEKRISDYFTKNLLREQDNRRNTGTSGSGFRLMAGHL